jgi:hypothetical protein
VDLVLAIDDTLSAFDALIKRSNVEVRFSPQNCPPVVSQQVLLTQILNSLFANALEAMPKGGVLSIELNACSRTGVPDRQRYRQGHERSSSKWSSSRSSPPNKGASGLAWPWSNASWSVSKARSN